MKICTENYPLYSIVDQQNNNIFFVQDFFAALQENTGLASIDLSNLWSIKDSVFVQVCKLFSLLPYCVIGAQHSHCSILIAHALGPK